MRNYELGYRFRSVFLPLLLLALSLAATYSALDWLLIIKTGWLPINQELVDFWLPFALSAISVYVVITPRLRSFRLSKKNNIPFLYALIAGAAVAAPMVTAQLYLQTATGKLTTVHNANLITTRASTKYYKIESLCLNRLLAKPYPVFETNGRHSEQLSFYIYVAVPICNSSSDWNETPVWLGLKYHDEISARSNVVKRKAAFKSFAERSQQAFNALDASQYRYYQRIGMTRDRRDFDKSIERSKLPTSGQPIILIPHTEPFSHHERHRLQALIYSVAIGSIGWLLLILIPSIDAEARSDERKHGNARRKREWQAIRRFIIPRRDFYGLPLLIDINIGVYIVMVFAGLGVASFQTDDLLAWGANFAPYLHGLGLLRLITSQFVHGGLMHISGNMYGLLFAGIFLIPIAANMRLIACYLLCGTAGNIAGAYIHPHTISVGASGAILGLWGVLLSLTLLRDQRTRDGRNMILGNAAIFVGLTLLMGFASPGIDNAAHLGGLVLGMILGLVFYFVDRRHVTNTARPHG